jgi:hypothetical protein
MSDDLRDKIISLAKAREAREDAASNAASDAEIEASMQLYDVLRDALDNWLKSTGTQFDDDKERLADVLYWGGVYFFQYLLHQSAGLDALSVLEPSEVVAFIRKLERDLEDLNL